MLLFGLLIGWGPGRGPDPSRRLGAGASGGDGREGSTVAASGGRIDGRQAPPEAPRRVEGSFFVRLRPGVDPSAAADDIARDHGGEAAYVYEYALHGFNYRGSDEAHRSLRSDPRVEGVDPDYEVHIAAETITKDVKRIRASHTNAAVQTSYGAGYTGAGVYVGILDTGIDYTHEDIADNMAPQSMWKNCRGTSLPWDDHGHGTAISGDVAARDNTIGLRGAAPRAAVIPIKVLDSGGSGSTTNVACGVDHLTALANANPSKRFVGNMSLAGGGSSSSCDSGLRKAICTSVAAGVVYTAAAGNADRDARDYWPASFPEVIAVSALNDGDGEPGGDSLASFSNFGPAVDVIAPGVNVLALRRGNQYATSSGTSHAAPFVAGVAALIRALNPSLTPAGVLAVLQSSGECPDRTFNVVVGNCPASKGQWSGDGDGMAEPLVRAFEAAADADVGAPRVTWQQPAAGAVLTGNAVPVAFDVEDFDTSGTIEQPSVASVELRVGSTTVRSWTLPATGTFEHALDTSVFSDGSKSMSVRVVDLDGRQLVLSRSLTFSNAPPWVEDFEDGVSGASTGWTFTGLWHRADAAPGSGPVCPFEPYASYSHSLYYGRDVSCDYHTGGSNSGTATSPTITGLPSQVEVGFSSFRVIQRDVKVREKTFIQASYNGGGSWQTVWTRTSVNLNDTDWTSESIVLKPPSGSLRLRFVFQADKTNNTFPGWFIDDIVVASHNDAPQVGWQEPANGAVVWGDAVPVAFSGADEDADDTLGAEWLVNGVSMGVPAYDPFDGRYEAVWDTTGLTDGWYRFEARLVDSADGEGRAFLDVRFDTANDAPTVSWSRPSNGNVVVQGSIPVRIAAGDDRYGPDDVGVQWSVNGTLQGTAIYNAATGFYEDTWDTSGVTEGSYTLRAVATDGAGADAAAEITVQVTDAALYQDFEQPLDGWTAGGLWAVRQGLTCTTGATYASASNAAYYGNPSICQYHTGSRTSGNLVSPVFDLGGPATLTFAHRRQVESSSRLRDVTSVDVSYDGGTVWQRVWQLSAQNPSSPDWQTASVPLGGSGTNVRVRFGFDSMDNDNNRFLGWIVDDVVIAED